MPAARDSETAGAPIQADVGWERSAADYAALYRQLLSREDTTREMP